MKTSTRIITAVLLIAGSSSVVYALNRHSDWGMSPEDKVEFVTERAAKKLDLDAAQQQNFSALADNIVQIMLEVRETRQENLDEVYSLLEQPNFDQAKALEMILQKTELVNQKAPQVLASLAIFLDSLNPDQKAEMREFLEHHREHRHRH